MTRQPKVYIAGPYTKPNPSENVNRVVRIASQIRSVGFCPFVPHLTMLWDAIVPHDYEYWMAYDAEWLKACEALLRMPGESPGADREIEQAAMLGIPVFYSVDELCAHYGVNYA